MVWWTSTLRQMSQPSCSGARDEVLAHETGGHSLPRVAGIRNAGTGHTIITDTAADAELFTCGAAPASDGRDSTVGVAAIASHSIVDK